MTKNEDRTPPGRWECPKCGTLVETMVPTIGPPTCSRHTGGAVRMGTTTKPFPKAKESLS